MADIFRAAGGGVPVSTQQASRCQFTDCEQLAPKLKAELGRLRERAEREHLRIQAGAYDCE